MDSVRHCMRREDGVGYYFQWPPEQRKVMGASRGDLSVGFDLVTGFLSTVAVV